MVTQASFGLLHPMLCCYSSLEEIGRSGTRLLVSLYDPGDSSGFSLAFKCGAVKAVPQEPSVCVIVPCEAVSRRDEPQSGHGLCLEPHHSSVILDAAPAGLKHLVCEALAI